MSTSTQREPEPLDTLQCPLLGVKRTSGGRASMSAIDPKRTFRLRRQSRQKVLNRFRCERCSAWCFECFDAPGRLPSFASLYAELWNAANHSTLMPAPRITLPHFLVYSMTS